jgi:hypothetical protein
VIAKRNRWRTPCATGVEESLCYRKKVPVDEDTLCPRQERKQLGAGGWALVGVLPAVGSGHRCASKGQTVAAVGVDVSGFGGGQTP